MKIGKIAKQLGTTESTLRFYEERELVHPKRTPKGTRDYSKRDLQRFQTILELTAVDVPIETIHALTQLRSGSENGDTTSRTISRSLREVEEQLSARVTLLQATLDDINQARKRLVACRGCKKTPSRSTCGKCGVARDLLSTRIMHIVWDEDDNSHSESDSASPLSSPLD